MDNEKAYKEFVVASLDFQWHLFHSVMYRNTTERIKGLAWLQIMGLIETQDIIYDR